MSLPAALQPFSHYRQFITYKLVPSQSRPGKMDKIPTDWRNGGVANAHDSAIWTDYDTAFANGGLVGFVFTPNDPFWFLDIDDCLLPNGWSPLATELCGLLSGAAVEISQSGKGLHIFGTGQVPKHSCKGPTGSGLEFYHEGRFVALGGRGGSSGSAAFDCTATLPVLIDRYFKRSTEEAPLAEWSNGPVPEWVGSVNDEDLIRRACNSKSASGVFGSKATFAQLWDADEAALSRAYPDTMGERQYDASSADAALAQHLAFWTGKDCERIKRLMLQSKLVRDKWEREDYLPRTILQAVSKQIDVCKDKPVELLPAGSPTKEVRNVEGDTYLNPESQKLLFAGCCFIADRNAIILPGGHIYKQEVFDTMLGGFTFVLDHTNSKTTKSAFEAFTKSQCLRFPKAHISAFRPDKGEGEVWQSGNDLCVNTYYPIKVPSKQGNPRPFLDHIARILPDKKDQAIILAYMAAVVQHRGIKFQWTPLIQGAPGNGKTLLSRCLVEAVGKKHCHVPNTQELTDKFNDWIDGRIFIAVEDVYVPQERREVLEALKPMITSDWLEIQGKGRDKASRFICANFLLNSNHKDAIRKTRDDRRFAVFYCQQQTASDIERDGMGGDYFPNLYSWLKRDGYAIITDYLAHYPIPDELNPAKDCHRAPATSSTEEAVKESMGSLEQEIMAAVLEERVGFRNGWISSHWLDMLIKDLGAGYRVARNKRKGILLDLGFEPHPGLEGGQVHNPVSPDGMKPRLFIRKNHPSEHLRGVAVAKQYEKDQAERSIHLSAVGFG